MRGCSFMEGSFMEGRLYIICILIDFYLLLLLLLGHLKAHFAFEGHVKYINKHHGYVI